MRRWRELIPIHVSENVSEAAIIENRTVVSQE